MESGTSLDLWALSRHPRSTAFHLGRSLGILTANSGVLISALRRYDYRVLQTASNIVEVGVSRSKFRENILKITELSPRFTIPLSLIYLLEIF